ncbi:hypothetical protein J2847_004093 [Azospirillum agricola]|uniref:hypothetical protein n=1 Tax=Azospirillum agricola TaxID=1720247 RepID=UPI001AE584C2|nr:hypothetical protein [Azospirillum agricola]MBP2230784.1 hypothetical protein [Azospirillum agricola]
MSRRPTLSQLQAQVEAWNADHPIGSPVVVRLDTGETRHTITRSSAYVLSGHSAVIFLDGIRGCYLLDRVRPGKPEVLAEKVA